MKNEKLAIPFITLSKSVAWLSDLVEYSKDFIGKVTYVAPLMYRSLKNLHKASKDIVKGLVESTTLSKKQSKKIADNSMAFVEESFEADTRFSEFSFLETNLLMIYSIRSNKSYAKDVHQYCDEDLKLIRETIEDEDSEEWLTIAHNKSLRVLIDKHMNSFDKYKESKKYNGIWY